MPLIPDYTVNATYRWSPLGYFLLVINVLDGEDNREHTLYIDDPDSRGIRWAMDQGIQAYFDTHAL